jgi:hypothetical protein
MTKKRIHTTLDEYSLWVLHKIMNDNNCHLNDAILILAKSHMSNNEKIKEHIMSTITQEVMNKYMKEDFSIDTITPPQNIQCV